MAGQGRLLQAPSQKLSTVTMRTKCPGAAQDQPRQSCFRCLLPQQEPMFSQSCHATPTPTGCQRFQFPRRTALAPVDKRDTGLSSFYLGAPCLCVVTSQTKLGNQLTSLEWPKSSARSCHDFAIAARTWSTVSCQQQKQQQQQQRRRSTKQKPGWGGGGAFLNIYSRLLLLLLLKKRKEKKRKEKKRKKSLELQ